MQLSINIFFHDTFKKFWNECKNGKRYIQMQLAVLKRYFVLKQKKKQILKHKSRIKCEENIVLSIYSFDEFKF